MKEIYNKFKKHIVNKEFLYKDAHYLSTDVEINPKVASEWLPLGLNLRKPARATIFTAWFPDNPFNQPYTEAGLFLHVKYFGVNAIFCPWMLVSQSSPLVAGREVLGYPKKLADISFNKSNNSIKSSATRNGFNILNLNATLGPEILPSPFLGRRNLNITGNVTLPLPRLITFKPKEEIISVNEVDVELDIFSESSSDYLSELITTTNSKGMLHRVNIGMDLRSVPVPIIPTPPTYILKHYALRNH